MGSGFQHPLLHTRHFIHYRTSVSHSNCVREDGFTAERGDVVAFAFVVVMDHPDDVEAWDYPAD